METPVLLCTVYWDEEGMQNVSDLALAMLVYGDIFGGGEWVSASMTQRGTLPPLRRNKQRPGCRILTVVSMISRRMRTY